MKYETKAKQALAEKGYEFVKSDGVNDWQGWVILLGHNKNTNKYAIIYYGYGSCSGCDSRENLSEEEIVKGFIKNMDEFDSLEEAEKFYEEHKSW
jgi:hypothetical protein